MAVYKLRVSDKEGLWGELRVHASSRTEAEEKAEKHMAKMSRTGDTEVDIATLKLTMIERS